MMQGLKLMYDQMRECDLSPSSAPAFSSHDGTIYQGPGHTRNPCMVEPNGKRMFFNYAYLVFGEFMPREHKTLIRPYFSSNAIKGI